MSEVFDVSGFDQFFDSPGDILDRDIRVDAMLIEQVDAVGPKSLQRILGHFADAFGAAVESVRRLAVLETELGRDDDLVSIRSKCFSEQFFVIPRSVRFGGVKERDTKIDGRMQQSDCFVLFDRGTVAETQAHTAETEGGNFQIAVSKFSFLHRFLILISKVIGLALH